MLYTDANNRHIPLVKMGAIPIEPVIIDWNVVHNHGNPEATYSAPITAIVLMPRGDIITKAKD